MKCRHCHHPLQHRFVDLGFAPPSNAYLSISDLNKAEVHLPLQVYVCEKCWLVQTKDTIQADDLFCPDYAYFSSVSSSWLQHVSDYVEMIIEQEALDQQKLVIEIACNDGYLLKNFVKANIPCIGIEPAKATAEVAKTQGIPVITEFFTQEMAQVMVAKSQQADLLIGNNVLAHVPDINGFVDGLKTLLKPSGTITMEFPHLLELINHNQFDTIYHEHFSYLSLIAVQNIFADAGLRIFNVQQLPTHGGSLRIFACHQQDSRKQQANMEKLIKKEQQHGLQQLGTYLNFQPKVDHIKHELLSFLLEQKRLNKTVIGYGAAAKGNTLLNYASVKPDLLPAICDAAPSKQGKLMPGSHIPIYAPSYLEQHSADYILLLPWNIQHEVKEQLSHLTNSKIVVAIPELEVIK